MKRFFTLATILLSLNLLAQNNCTLDHILFNPPTDRKPQPIHALGNNPQIKCLQNIGNDKIKFYNTIQQCKTVPKYKVDFDELDEIFKNIGFSNGLNDPNFTTNSLSYETIAAHTLGMLGYKKNKKIGYVYSELTKDVRGWKIISPAGCFVYIFTQCGNAFYPKQRHDTTCPPCPKVTINYNGDIKMDTCQATSTQKEILIKVYAIYSHTKRVRLAHQKQEQRQEITINDSILIQQEKMEIQECNSMTSANQYKVEPFSMSEVICKDSIINLSIQIEHTTSPVPSQANYTSGFTSDKIIKIDVDKKTFRRLKKFHNQK